MSRTYSLRNSGYQKLRLLLMRTCRQNFFVICVIAIALALSIAPASASKTPAPGKSKIIVGGEIGYPPYSFLNDQGNPTGFQVELTRAIAKTMGINIEIRLSPWPKARKALEDGTIDIIPGMFYSDERAKIYDFSPPFSIVSTAIFARKNSPAVQSIEDLRNKEIIVMRGEAMHDYIIKHRLTEKILLTETPGDALRMLASGKGDYALIAQIPGFYWIKELKLSNVTSVGPSLEPFKNCFAVRKGNTLLLSRFTEGLNILNQTGEYQKISEKWLGVMEPTRINFAIGIKYAAIVLVPLILLLAFSLLWSRMLRSRVNKKTKELRESEEKYRTLVENATDMVFRTDAYGNFTFANPAALRFAGYNEEDIIGRQYTILLPPEKREEALLFFGHQLIKGIPNTYSEYPVITKDGQEFWVGQNAQLVVEGDTSSGFQIVARDITERKRAEGALRESEERYRMIFNNSPLGVMHFDANGIIIDFNDKFAEIMGGTREKIIGFNMMEQLRNQAMLTAVKDALDGRLGYYEGDYVSITAGKTTPMRAICQRITTAEGKFLGAVGLFEDITDRKRVEEEKQSLQERLNRAEKMEAIGTLAGGIAHDFNNILAAIIGYAELAMDGNQKEKYQQYLQETLKGAERAKNLVKQILTFSRQDEHEKKPLDFKPLLEEAVKFLRASIPTTIEIHQNITEESCNILADPTQMHQIIMNLCTNASHAMKQKGGVLNIDISTLELAQGDISDNPDLQPGNYVKLTVGDTGYGIAPDKTHRIFDPFFTTKSKDEGTGLGLSVVYGIVKSHDGAINVYSKPGQGATFNVYLPRIIFTETMKVDTDKPAVGGTERILFVDDEPALVDLGGDILSSLGYEVTGVTSSMEALDMFRSGPQRFDLVITDMTLPKMTGIDLSREILQIRPDTPIILCSGIRESDTEDQVKSLGIRAYLTKPLTRKELFRVVRETLDGKEKAEDGRRKAEG